jgi:uncharacterized protein with ParB-like and HNH nuclease domain
MAKKTSSDKQAMDVEKIQSEEDDSQSSPVTYDILTYPADFTLEVLVDKLRKKDIKVPHFQRRFVWTQVQASRLIESFLLGLPVPPIFLYTAHKDGFMLVVDGQQRLRSVELFFSGEFSADEGSRSQDFRLVGLNPESPFSGKTYRDLEESSPESYRKLNDAVLRSFVVKQLNPQDDTSIYHIFERLNTGGTFLQGQEIRNCIYPGTFNNLLHELNKLVAWRDIFGKKLRDKRQRDAELILRFFALLHNRRSYEKPMKDFLNKFMSNNRNPSSEYISRFRREFTETTKRVHAALGARPFHIRAGLNAAVYDSIFVAFATNADADAPRAIRGQFDRLLKNDKYIEAVSSGTTDKEVIHRRINLASKTLFGAD